MSRYDLSTVPDLDDVDHDDYATARGRYLERAAPDLSKRQAKALAYREIGYSTGGIARKMETGEPTVKAYLETVAERFGRRALETRPQSEPVAQLE